MLSRPYFIFHVTFFLSNAESQRTCIFFFLQILEKLVASPNISNWDKKKLRVWIIFIWVQNLTVTGDGIIDGNGNISCKINISLVSRESWLSQKIVSVYYIFWKCSTHLHSKYIYTSDLERFEVSVYLICTIAWTLQQYGKYLCHYLGN